MKLHLDRKFLCQPMDDDHNISLDEYKSKINKPKDILISCEHCNKGFASELGIRLHKCPAAPIDKDTRHNDYRIKILEKQLEIMKQQMEYYKVSKLPIQSNPVNT